ncbi:hypothetical protein BCR34DRAFT_602904 [Clohesyomyces aquaticus]|uniref:Uncharacterized protein n=1 Tax=Clohesyomyces aquaticus TaxID=1231657 RepID=A0A1Y1ZGK0_9PLEO|nr:hypothetical protein BCR34DRAFT_602904 [Clohesyomyces aquaticus]
MGLPVWRAPSPEAKDATKVDLTASARSPIRRRSPFAGRRARGIRSPRSPRLPADFPTVAATQHDSAARPSSVRPRLPPPPVPESRNYSRSDATRDMHTLFSDGEDDYTLGRMRRERYYQSLAGSRLPSFGEVFRDSSRELPSLTPNFAPAAASRSSRPENAPEGRERPNFRSRSPYRRAGARSRNPWSPSYTNQGDAGGDDSSDNNAVGFPPLRRMGRRTIADGPLPSSSLRESWSPATTLDGLGDRDRSMSPVDDHWDTMLTTVAPDPLAPTAESSFASAAASASFSNSGPSSRAGSSNSNSASSSRTHLTVPSRRHSQTETFIRACDTSDDDTASDTEEEDMELRPEQIHTTRRAHWVGGGVTINRPAYRVDGPPSRDPTRYSRAVRERSRDASAYVRNYYSHTLPREPTQQSERPLSSGLDGLDDVRQNLEDEADTLEMDLQGARALLEGLAQRDDIPDEFWASIGLSRSAQAQIERLQDQIRL